MPLLRSRSLTLLLAYLFNTQGQESISISALARLLEVAASTANRDVAELEKAGLLKTRRAGNTKLVELNQDWPYFEEFATVFQKAFGPKPTLEQTLGGIAGIE